MHMIPSLPSTTLTVIILKLIHKSVCQQRDRCGVTNSTIENSYAHTTCIEQGHRDETPIQTRFITNIPIIIILCSMKEAY